MKPIPTYHLAVYRRDRSTDYLQLMLDGVKTVDIKLSSRRIAPYEKISPNDILFLKQSSGPVVGKCRIPWVEYYDTSEVKIELLDILMQHWKELGMRNEEHAISMAQKTGYYRYITLFGLDKAEEFNQPVHIQKRDRRVWIAGYIPSGNLKILT